LFLLLHFCSSAFPRSCSDITAFCCTIPLFGRTSRSNGHSYNFLFCINFWWQQQQQQEQQRCRSYSILYFGVIFRNTAYTANEIFYIFLLLLKYSTCNIIQYNIVMWYFSRSRGRHLPWGRELVWWCRDWVLLAVLEDHDLPAHSNVKL